MKSSLQDKHVLFVGNPNGAGQYFYRALEDTGAILSAPAPNAGTFSRPLSGSHFPQILEDVARQKPGAVVIAMPKMYENKVAFDEQPAVKLAKLLRDQGILGPIMIIDTSEPFQGPQKMMLDRLGAVYESAVELEPAELASKLAEMIKPQIKSAQI